MIKIERIFLSKVAENIGAKVSVSFIDNFRGVHLSEYCKKICNKKYLKNKMKKYYFCGIV